MATPLERVGVPERQWFERAIAKGLGLYAVRVLQGFVRESFYGIDRSFKTAAEPVTKGAIALGLSFVKDMIPEPFKDMSELAFADAVKDGVALVIEKTPAIVALSDTEIEFHNFDPNETLTYSIDGGAAETTSTDANGYAKVTLSAALSAGKHNIVAFTKTKAKAQVVVI